jgi:aspartyl/glutamyl-tRNA(Asn/Gln) amidotransferase C subunit
MTQNQLTVDDVKKLADLSKINIDDSEALGYLKDLNGVLNYVSLIADVDIKADNMENPTKYNFHSIVRSDMATEQSDDKDILWQNVPSKSNDKYVKVSKVINKGK